MTGRVGSILLCWVGQESTGTDILLLYRSDFPSFPPSFTGLRMPLWSEDFRIISRLLVFFPLSLVYHKKPFYTSYCILHLYLEGPGIVQSF